MTHIQFLPRRLVPLVSLLTVLLALGCSSGEPPRASNGRGSTTPVPTRVVPTPSEPAASATPDSRRGDLLARLRARHQPLPEELNPDTPWLKVAVAARAQLAVPTVYVPDYVRLDYPGGDVPRGTGVCTDVVVRALRAIDLDLQELIHEDMEARFDEYPRKWGLRRPDPNIDHRRVPNQICYLRRFASSLPLEMTPATRDSFRPGDLVYWKLPNNLDHCGVLSTRRRPDGLPLAVHNLGAILEEDCVDDWRVIGHFRFPKPEGAGTP